MSFLIKRTIFFIFIVLSCCPFTKRPLNQKIEDGGIEILFGKISREYLFEAYPDWIDQYENYSPDPLIVDKISALKKKVTIEIFLGTWCADSKREVPKFFKILDKSGLSKKTSVKLYAVNLQKKTIGEMAENRNVKRVPTFIFLENEHETGRIIEQPDITLEADMIQILLNSN